MAERDRTRPPRGGAGAQRVDGRSRAREALPLPLRIKKRDGRDVPFDRAKISAAIARAMAAVGDDDLQFAEEVAHVVALELAQRNARPAQASEPSEGDLGRDEPASARGEAPDIEAIQDLVEQALIDLGRGRVAKAYILYRERRTRIREVLQLQAPESSQGEDGVRVRDSRGVRPWTKGRIVAALLEEADLPRGTAEEVASRVERRVLDSGLSRVTTALVRELVAGELMDMGLTGALRRQGTIGLPRHDLRRILACTPLAPWAEERATLSALTGSNVADVEPPAGPDPVHVESVIAGEVLTRFTLEDVLGDELAAMHVGGELSIEGIEAPHRPLTIGVPAELLASGEAGPQAAFELLDGAAELARCASRGLVLEDPGTALFSLARAARPGSPLGLAAWLRSLGAASRAAGRRVDLGSPGTRYSAFAARLVQELARLAAQSSSSWTPRLFLEEEELATLSAPSSDVLEPLESCLRHGVVVPVWSSPGERFAGPGCRRRARERTAVACAAAISLNLPRVARRAGPWREDLVLESLSGLVEFALDSCRRISDLQRRHSSARAAAALGGVRLRSTFALVPVGLREALRILGDGEVDPSQGARLLGFLAEAARRFGTQSGIELVPDVFYGARAAARFAWLDAGAEQRDSGRQHQLFGESSMAEAARTDRERPYTTGLLLTPCAGYWPGEAEGELAMTLAAGALHPFPEGPPRPGITGGAKNARLAAWRAFESGRCAPEPELEHTLFPSPRAAALLAAKAASAPGAVAASEPVPPEPVASPATPRLSSPEPGDPADAPCD